VFNHHNGGQSTGMAPPPSSSIGLSSVPAPHYTQSHTAMPPPLAVSSGRGFGGGGGGCSGGPEAVSFDPQPAPFHPPLPDQFPIPQSNGEGRGSNNNKAMTTMMALMLQQQQQQRLHRQQIAPAAVYGGKGSSLEQQEQQQFQLKQEEEEEEEEEERWSRAARGGPRDEEEVSGEEEQRMSHDTFASCAADASKASGEIGAEELGASHSQPGVNAATTASSYKPSTSPKIHLSSSSSSSASLAGPPPPPSDPLTALRAELAYLKQELEQRARENEALVRSNAELGERNEELEQRINKGSEEGRGQGGEAQATMAAAAAAATATPPLENGATLEVESGEAAAPESAAVEAAAGRNDVAATTLAVITGVAPTLSAENVVLSDSSLAGGASTEPVPTRAKEGVDTSRDSSLGKLTCKREGADAEEGDEGGKKRRH